MSCRFARNFDEALAARPDATFLHVRGESGEAATLSYVQVDEMARRLAQVLAGDEPLSGTFVPVCLGNEPAHVAHVLAAAREGFALVELNPRLSDAERELRLGALRAAGAGALPPAPEGTAVVMFTSGTTGVPKAVRLSWDNLCGSAEAANGHLGCGPGDEALWQAALPLCHVGGLQMVVRSVLAGRPLALYAHFDARRILADAEVLGATHLSVVDKTLRDLLDADDARVAVGEARVLPRYRCVLLGGSAPNPSTLARAVAAGVPLVASYGMTETASLVACASVHPGFDGWLDLLDGYEARVEDAGTGCEDEAGEPVPGRVAASPGKDTAEGSGAAGGMRISPVSGVRRGELAVAGPGVTDGYMNASTPRTSDGFLRTGDVAELDPVGRRVRVRERTGDMFVSGGENVYPAEVEAALRELPGVRDACVLGVLDATWGRRPVAFVETDRPADELRARLEGRLSHVNMPRRICCMPELPRTVIGKIDRRALLEADE